MNKNLFRHSLIGLLERNLITNKEICGLYKDYLSIERLWWSNFDNFGSIKLVLIGESPLSSGRYIYNKDNDAKDSAFLLIKDLKECLRKSGKKPIDLKSKGKMEAMLDLGLLVLDMFPFAFNSEIKKFNYQNIDQEHLKLTKKKVILMPGKEHKELLKDLYFKSYSWHLSSKVKKIMSKVREDTIYAYRYTRSAKLELDVFPKIQPTCLGGKAYGINPEKLYEIFNK